jgi:hypothetical protein
MGVLNRTQIEELIRRPKASLLLGEAKALQDKHKLHISGEGFDETLKQIEGLESTVDHAIKKDHAQPTTTRIFSQVLNQFKKVFRAQGFSRNHKFKNNNKELIEDFWFYLKNVSSGLSMQELMEVVWFQADFKEFNGVFIVELPKEQKGDHAEPFVDFIPLKHIHDIMVRGKKIEYIIFESEITIKQGQGDKTVKKYRVIDDVADYNFMRDGDVITLMTREEFDEDGEIVTVEDVIPNTWGYVPCIQPSTVYDNLDSDTLKTSHIVHVMPNADSYLSISNSHAVSVKKHQHPIFYSFPVTCPSCNSTGTVEGKDHEFLECQKCNGHGSVPFYNKNPGEGISLPEPDENNSVNKAEAPCGYVSVDIDSIQDQREELKFEENNIEKGSLGVEGILLNKSKRETATGKEIDLQPLIDKLTFFSANGESVEGFLTNTIAKARYGKDYIGSDINWGRKFFVRTEQMIEIEYGEAKKNGLPVSALKELLEELYFTKFDNNPKALTRSLLLLELEPFPTSTTQEVIDTDIANEIDVVIKLYFADFIEELEREVGDIISFVSASESNLEVVKKKLQEMGASKIKTEDENEDVVSNEERTSRLQAIIDVNTAVASGSMSRESGVAALVKMYKFEDSVAEELISTEIPTNTEEDG